MPLPRLTEFNLLENRRYRYVKDPEDKHRWIVEETAANVVRRIFKLYVDGYGPSQIASILEKDKVLVPSSYYKSIGVKGKLNFRSLSTNQKNKH